MMEKKYTDEKNYLSVRIKWCALLAAGLIGAFLVRMWVVCIREMQSLMVPAVFTALSAALAVIVYRTVLIPYRETRKIYEQFVMGYVMEDLFKVRYPFSPESEQAVLRLNEIIDRNNLIAISKKQAEYLALQNQINPHFLYNTLDCIRGYGYMLNSSEIVSITNALSSIMRYCIKGADIVALRKEMTIVNYYLDIIRIRFPNRFNYVFDVDPALEDLAIPRFIIQPVVENAIYHGLESRLEKGTLTISCHTTETGGCALCVTDDGVGIPQERLAEIHRKLSDKSMQNVLNVPAGNSLALVNIHNRLRNLYGANYGLDIVCPPEGGTGVTLHLPMLLVQTETEQGGHIS